MKYDLRTAYIAKDYESNDISDNIRVKIVIENNIIPMNISQIFGKASDVENRTEREPDKIEYRISLKSEFTDKKQDSEVKSSLYEDYETTDDDGNAIVENRYVYIGHAYSILYNSYELFWFDKKYGDILKIVELTTLIDLSGDSKVLPKSNIVLGEVISLRTKPLENFKFNSPKVNLEKVDRRKFIENVNDISGIKTHLLKVKFGNNSYLEINNRGMILDTDNYIEGTWDVPIECYSLGGAEELFDQDDYKISSLRNHTNITLRESMFDFIGDVNLDDILIIR